MQKCNKRGIGLLQTDCWLMHGSCKFMCYLSSSHLHLKQVIIATCDIWKAPVLFLSTNSLQSTCTWTKGVWQIVFLIFLVISGIITLYIFTDHMVLTVSLFCNEISVIHPMFLCCFQALRDCELLIFLWTHWWCIVLGRKLARTVLENEARAKAIDSRNKFLVCISYKASPDPVK